MKSALFLDEVEKNQHEAAISRLCDEYPAKCEFIRKSYLENLEPMIADASIRTYLPIFISRKVKDTLENTH